MAINFSLQQSEWVLNCAEAPAVRGAVPGAEDSLLSLGRVAANNSAREAIRVKDSFMAHFSAEGALTWQPTE
ncbi:hypothetical protein G5714_004247 [Onychostoma macrolepis]|uniref:Uncharacterized protein n=1 Tax=Onychostoma macrolepis TaxID=369639 RepID=A0A7J6D4N8_9TELE|nr:hypothetical protein G5714_004247 [Onychostoma macrolepis]